MLNKTKKSSARTWLLAIILSLSISPLAYAQAGAATGLVVGRVLDATGNPLANVSVSVRSPGTNLSRQVQTNEKGLYLISNLPPGAYEIKVTASSFASQVSRVDIEVGATIQNNDFVLNAPAADDKPVKVKAAGLFDFPKTESSTNMNNRRFNNLPISLRNVFAFSLTTPRATSDKLPIGTGVGATSRLSFNAQQARFNNTTVDGLDFYDRNTGTFRLGLSQGTVQELQVVSDSYSAEFGRSVGGVINIITKSGNNEFHGGAFYYGSSDNISAKDPFRLVGDFEVYQPGGFVTGPIKKDRAFFFAGFGRITLKQDNIVTISDQIVQSAARQGYLISNGPIPFSIGAETFFGKADVKVSNSDSLTFRYNGSFGYNGVFQGFGRDISDTAAARQYLDDNSGAIINTYNNPNLRMVNESRLLIGRRGHKIIPTRPDAQSVIEDNFPVGSNTLGIVNDPKSLTVFGGNVFLPQPFQDRYDEKYVQAVNITSLLRAKHHIKFGVDFFGAFVDGRVPLLDQGVGFFDPFDFGPNAPQFTGLATFDPSVRTPAQRAFLKQLAKDFTQSIPGFPLIRLEDLPFPTIYGQGFGDPNTNTSLKLFSTFVQDEFRPTSNLLIRAGVRYDLQRLRFFPSGSGFVSPRVGFSYRFKQLPNLTLNASYGLYAAAPVYGTSLAVGILNPEAGKRKVTILEFPFSVLAYQQPGHQFPSSNSIPAGVNFVPQFSTNVRFQPDGKDSYSHQAKLGLSYLYGANTTFSVEYVYVRGVRLSATRNINPVVRITPGPGGVPISQKTGRVDPTKGNLLEIESAYDSYYHGVTFGVNKRFSKHFSLLSNYTLSKAIDNVGDYSATIRNDALEPGGERSLSAQDARHRFVASGVWDLNYTKNVLLTGFQIASIITAESGHPYNLAVYAPFANSVTEGVRPDVRPNNISRNLGVTPDFATIDVRLTRVITLKEKYRIIANFEVFNLANKVNIRQVNGNFLADANGTFHLPPKEGKRFSTSNSQYVNSFSPRQIQISVGFTF